MHYGELFKKHHFKVGERSVRNAVCTIVKTATTLSSSYQNLHGPLQPKSGKNTVYIIDQTVYNNITLYI